ncbi:hypothetical protein HpCK71_12850 [Helicobacter pylori]
MTQSNITKDYDKNQLTLLEQILDSKIEVLPTLPTQQRFRFWSNQMSYTMQ